jgi:hypothetical protein
MHTHAIGVSLALLLLTCGKSAPPRAEPPAEPPVATGPFPLYPALCRFVARCRPELLSLFPSGSLDGCLVHAACSDEYTRRLRTVLADPAACLSFVEAAECSALEARYAPTTLTSIGMAGVSFGVDDACGFDYSSVLNGADAGEACLTRSETEGCASGLFCQPTLPPRLVGKSHCGLCEARAATGAACDEALPCVANHRCAAGFCRRLLDEGETCETDEQCRFRTCTANRCERPAEEPELPLADLADLGERCDPEAYSCRAGQVCFEGMCVDVGCTHEVGEPCQGDRCTPASACDEETHRCAAEPGLGEPCQLACTEPYVCDATSDSCVEELAIGAACRDDRNCATRFCDRDYAPYCELDGCTIPPCEADCGVCAEAPTRAACD